LFTARGGVVTDLGFTTPPKSAKSAEMTERKTLDRITENIIGAAIEVHRVLGPGLLRTSFHRRVRGDRREITT